LDFDGLGAMQQERGPLCSLNLVLPRGSYSDGAGDTGAIQRGFARASRERQISADASLSVEVAAIFLARARWSWLSPWRQAALKHGNIASTSAIAMRASTPQAIYSLIREFFCAEDGLDWQFPGGASLR